MTRGTFYISTVIFCSVMAGAMNVFAQAPEALPELSVPAEQLQTLDPAQAPEALPPIDTEQQVVPPVAPAQPMPTAAPTPSAAVGSEWQGSVMFSLDEITRLKALLDALIRRRDNPQSAESDYLQEITGQQQATTKPGEVPVVFPTFYLSTIMYLSPDEWIVWVNGKRVDQATGLLNMQGDQTGTSLHIEYIKGNEVGFRWKSKPQDIPAMQAAWSKAEQSKVMQDPVGSSNGVTTDPATGEVLFSLRPNQTFILEALKIIEGRLQWKRTVSYAPRRTANAPQEAAGDIPIDPATAEQGTTDADASPQPGQGVATERQSMDAMINQYQNISNAVKK